MEDQSEVLAAAEAVTAEPIEPPKKKRKAKEKPPEPPQPTEVVVTFSGIQPKDVAKAVAALLSKLSERTKTEPPSKEEVDSISSGLALGLQHTKVAIDPNSGPWIPLGLASLAYALPRLLDVVMRSQTEKESAESGTFRQDQTEGQATPSNAPGA